jgi:hypothetical protein
MKPILFNTEMVKAILDGRKITTRRIIKPKCKRNFIGTGIDGKPAECKVSTRCRRSESMERSTRLDGDGYFVVDGDSVYEDQNENFCGEPIDRLAAYEDTGLMPDEIEVLKREYLKICPKPKHCPFLRTFSHGQGCFCGLEEKGESNE